MKVNLRGLSNSFSFSFSRAPWDAIGGSSCSFISLSGFKNNTTINYVWGEKINLMVVKVHMAYRNGGENIEC